MQSKPGFRPSRAATVVLRRAGIACPLLAALCACAPRDASVQGGPPPPPRLMEADTPFTPAPQAEHAAPPPPIPTVDVAVLHVKCPSRAHARMDGVWAYLDEQRLDHDTRLGLSRNGLRVGCGHNSDWLEIKSIVDSIDGCQSLRTPPVRLPRRFPLDLELDDGPRNQTLFAFEPDGVLSGATWSASRNVFRLVYDRDRRARGRLQLSIVPVVRQAPDGYNWIPTDAGVAQVPRYAGRLYPGAAFTLSIARGEFLVIAPGTQASLRGLIGCAFMTSRADDDTYESFLFLFPAIPDEPDR